MQLVAYGAQDIYLTGNPQITFFKVVYRRHTNFSMEAIEQTINGTVATNARVTVTISRNGDLVGRTYLQHTSSENNTLNETAVELTSAEVEIGGQRIDKQHGHFMEVWAELTENKTGRVFGTNFQTMSGMGQGAEYDAAALAGVDGAGSAGALVAFNFPAGNATRVCITPLQFWFCRNPGLALPLIALQYHEVKIILNFATIVGSSYSIWCDYMYLDTDERRRFAQVSHEYLIEQVQHQNFPAATSLTLSFNHPVKELILAGAWGSGAFATIAAAATTMKLQLNGHDRMAARETQYFTRCQIWQHHSGEGGFVENSIGVYSFALKPEEHQPSGTCNFSRIDNAKLIFSADPTGVTNVYAINYNVLRVMSGMGGLAYSN